MPAKALQDLTTDDVLSVYSGRARTCCCGCAGKHTTNPKYRALRELTRGYEVDEDECSLRTVKMILNKCKRNGAKDEGDYFFFETPTRVYIVYLKPSDKEIEELKERRLQVKAQEAVRKLKEQKAAVEALKGAGI